MARLRYNGLSTTLGGSLTNVATSVTFAAALTHSNGTNVPTITGSDYIPLAILGATGHLSEIVYLTAYTAAGTTGTISRGKEGTAGAAHSSGDVVTQSPLTADFGTTARITVRNRGAGANDFNYSLPGWANGLSTAGNWSVASAAPVVSEIYFTPILVAETSVFDAVGVNVTTLFSGGVVRLGLYSADAATYAPAALLNDFGTLSTTTTGIKTTSISLTLAPGLYWLAGCADNATVVLGSLHSNASSPLTTVYSDPTTQPYVTPVQTGAGTPAVSGLPSPAGTISWPRFGNTRSWVFLRYDRTV